MDFQISADSSLYQCIWLVYGVFLCMFYFHSVKFIGLFVVALIGICVVMDLRAVCCNKEENIVSIWQPINKFPNSAIHKILAGLVQVPVSFCLLIFILC